MDIEKSTYTLNNGVKIPAIGFGTFRMPNGSQTEKAVLNALQTGYRGIDCAAVYGNEESVGEALRSAGIPRGELFITSKLWNDEKGYDSTLKAFHQTLSDLKLDYLDLYLIHWPIAKASRDHWQEANRETWRAFEDLYQAGEIKAIGVSNFLPHHLEPLMAQANIAPMVDQIEFHPGLPQNDTLKFCAEHKIRVEAWAPLSSGQLSSLSGLKDMAERYRKSVAQIALRWIIQKGVIPLPKSVTPSRIDENFRVFDFELAPRDMEMIDRLTDCGNSGLDPDHIDF